MVAKAGAASPTAEAWAELRPLLRTAWVQVGFADTGYRRHVSLTHRRKGNRHQPADTSVTTHTVKPGYDLVTRSADADRTLEWRVEGYTRNRRPARREPTAPPAG